MKYCDICEAFYIPAEESGTGEAICGLKSATSQGSIAERLMTLTWSEESTEGILPDNISTYNKWFYGTTGQKKAVWNRFKKDFDEDKYVKLLEEDINPEIHQWITKKLQIKVGRGKQFNDHRLAISIARQMQQFANSRKAQNEADSIIPDTYAVGEVDADFEEYIEKSKERYNVMKLLGGNEVPLEGYFVCNTLGEKPRVTEEKEKMKCIYIDGATIESVRAMYTTKRFDARKAILLGSGGSGKTLMLQHLFLDGLDRFPETGLLPIFIELRYFTQGDEIESFIFKTVNARDNTFTKEILHQFLLDGKCPILMDGLDEIDPSDIADFQMKLNNFTENEFPRTQVILASRDCDAKNGINGYARAYVWPFDWTQSELLIDKILEANGTKDAKDTVLKYIENGFIKKNGAFATHPMLLTFVAMNYPKYQDFYGNHLLFYKKAYEALLTGHDDNKKPYDRVFHSVDNADQFSIVFREFCGRTYSKGVLEFDDPTFELYFNELTSHKAFENPHKMTLTNFKHDACSTACMMYERDLGIWYIDPGFQEFLFAEYYANQPSEVVRELENNLRGLGYDKFNKFDAFEMLYGFTQEKFELCIFLPFLERIFKGKEDEKAFADFLIDGYDQVAYTVIDEDLVEKYEKEHKVRRQIAVQSLNEPRTITLSYLSKILGVDPTFRYTTKDNRAECIEFSSIALTGEYAFVNGSDECLYLRRNVQSEFSNRAQFEKTHDTSQYIRDDKSEIICFGHEYQLDSLDMYDEPEKFTGVIQAMIDDQCDAYHLFARMKEYYKQLRREQLRKGIR